MKKKYITPSMEVIKVQVANMMAESMVVYDDITVGSGSMLGRDNAYGSSLWGEW